MSGLLSSPPKLKGAYLLMVETADSVSITLPGSGRMTIPPGTYLYVGSAMGGLAGRLRRHLRGERKRHWHIDHLLDAGRVVGVVPLPMNDGGEGECAVAEYLLGEVGRERAVAGFGCSDCGCYSHLWRVEGDFLHTKNKSS